MLGPIAWLVALGLCGETAEVEQLLKKGLELRKSGQDTQALELFREAYAKSKSARSLAQIGLAEHALGRWVPAEKSLKSALAVKDPWIKKNRASLEGALKVVGSHLGSLELIGGPNGAVVTLNGERAGTLPLSEPIRVVAGAIGLGLGLDGYWPISRTVEVPAGVLSREEVKMTPKEAPADAAAPPPAPAPAPAAASAPAGTAPTTVSAAAPVEGGFPIASWIALGAGAVGLGVGIAGIAIREGHASKWNSAECTPNNGRTREENCLDEIEGAESAGTIATIGFIGGGAALAASALIWMLASPGGDTTAGIEAGPDRIGVRVLGRF